MRRHATLRVVAVGSTNSARSECSSGRCHRDRSRSRSQLFVRSSLDEQWDKVADPAPFEMRMRIVHRSGYIFPGFLRVSANEALDYMTDLA